MKLRIVITEDGKVALFSDDGTFDEGSEKIKKIAAALNAQGITFEDEFIPEQHRHDDEKVLAAGHSHSHA